MIRRFSVLRRTFFVSLALGCCSCSQSDIPEMGFVKGKVTINGKPLTGADLEAAPLHGRPAYGVIQPDGSYVMMYKKNVPGTLLGLNRFSPVWPTSVRGPEFPPEYLNVEIEVKPGENTYNLEMISERQAWIDFEPKPLAKVSTITPIE